ncbi:MAG: leucyl/phenylalanyl-tRNA--protein transferase [bacterium]|nr:leucyl/phenylalanyl-tRNA--protein transferase [bacterium]
MPLFQLTDDIAFPPPWMADEDGLLAIGGDLSRERLILAYHLGIFPWYSDDQPILWWSPDPRMMLIPNEFHRSQSLNRLLKRGTITITCDTVFDQVIDACSQARGPGRDSTWITAEMEAAYCDLHQAGYAHSIEAWHDDALVGGLYGLSMGRCFFGESMFSAVPNASKVALSYLVDRAIEWGFVLIDCQVSNPHLESLGAREIPRMEFLELLDTGLELEPPEGCW